MWVRPEECEWTNPHFSHIIETSKHPTYIAKIMESLAADYIAWDPCPETKAVVEHLVQQNDVVELESLLSERLAFGTAGLRGPMGAGYNRMNDLVIMQTMQGLVRHLQEVCGDEAMTKGVVIGYDHREKGSLSSKHFAEICVAVLLSKNFKVILLENLVPTPFVPFGVTHYGCAAGIMVTASHNPKEDNGFKVYWGNGAQIIPPHDAGIARCISENLAPWEAPFLTNMENFLTNKLFHSLTDELAQHYFSRMEAVSVAAAPRQDPLRIAYTAMHGVGAQWIERAFRHTRAGNNLLPVLPVPSQQHPDPSFPTVKFPNPEEKGALNEAMVFAAQHHCQLIIANDPDADRLAAAELVATHAGGEPTWRLFTGNEIGIILGHYQIQNYLALSRAGPPLKPGAVVTTVVSSKMLQKIAAVEGIKYSDTLTGFKWIGNESIRLQAEGHQVLFSYEEALGYCVGDALTDKDGISAAIAFSELASSLHSAGVSLSQHLDNIYCKYGLFVSHNTYVFSYDKAVTEKIFQRLRQGGSDGSYITRVGGATATRIRDITQGFDSGMADKRSSLPLTPDSHMIMYDFDNSCSIILRTSGTEPKIKCYSEISSGGGGDGGGGGDSKSELNSTLVAFVNECIADLLQPDLNHLVLA